jgi:hypothetical protein
MAQIQKIAETFREKPIFVVTSESIILESLSVTLHNSRSIFPSCLDNEDGIAVSSYRTSRNPYAYDLAYSSLDQDRRLRNHHAHMLKVRFGFDPLPSEITT